MVSRSKLFGYPTRERSWMGSRWQRWLPTTRFAEGGVEYRTATAVMMNLLREPRFPTLAEKWIDTS